MFGNFEVAGGSVTGTDHVKVGKNNHDAFYWDSNQHVFAAVVCDGCSGGKHSEVGAWIGSQLIVETILRNAERSPRITCQVQEDDVVELQKSLQFLEQVRQDVLAQMRVLIKAMGKSVSQIVEDYFMFTTVGVIFTKWDVWFFSLGDGIIFVNGEGMQIGPFPDDAPPYLGYGLGGFIVDPRLLNFQIHRMIKIENVESLLIGTDGVVDLDNSAERKMPGKEKLVGSLSQFWQEDVYFKNPYATRNRLFLINRDVVKYERDAHSNITNVAKNPGLLPDDTTLVVMRRVIEEQGG